MNFAGTMSYPDPQTAQAGLSVHRSDELDHSQLQLLPAACRHRKPHSKASNGGQRQRRAVRARLDSKTIDWLLNQLANSLGAQPPARARRSRSRGRDDAHSRSPGAQGAHRQRTGSERQEHRHRTFIFGAFARAKSRVKSFSYGEDNVATMRAFESMGVRVEDDGRGRSSCTGRGSPR